MRPLETLLTLLNLATLVANAGTGGAHETLRDIDAIESDIGPEENVI
jgi:hypothetical protein